MEKATCRNSVQGDMSKQCTSQNYVQCDMAKQLTSREVIWILEEQKNQKDRQRGWGCGGGGKQI